MLKLVPFSSVWVTHDKLDLKAIYRRPRFVADRYGEMVRELTPDGLPAWDLTGPLNVRHHNKHTAKGFEYVTLADRESLRSAAAAGTIGPEWREFIQDPLTGSPWHYQRYADGQVEIDHIAARQLSADVAQFGADAVEAIRRQTDPTFRLPEAMRAEPTKRGPGRPRKVVTDDEVPA